MRFQLPTLKTAGSLVTSSALLAFGVIGCESAPSADDPVMKQAAQTQQEVIKKGEEEANAQLKKTGGKDAPVLRLSKPGARGAAAPTP